MAEGTQSRATVVRPLCEKHRSDLIHERLQIPESGPWALAEAAVSTLLFRYIEAQTSPSHAAEVAKLNCVACLRPIHYELAAKVAKRGLSHAFHVAAGNDVDPDWVWPT